MLKLGLETRVLLAQQLIHLRQLILLLGDLLKVRVHLLKLVTVLLTHRFELHSQLLTRSVLSHP